MQRKFWSLVRGLFVLALLGAAMPLGTHAAEPFPSVISLPDGWRPEGIATGRGPVLYAGSLANGAIYAIDLRTGEGRVLAPGAPGRITVGLSFDQRSNYIFAAGGTTGNAYVFDADSGELVRTYNLGGGFVNDVIVTRDAAYFTDSFRPVLYRIPLGPAGQLPAQDAVEEIPLSGEFTFIPGGFNANGIEATPDGKWLIVVHSTLGRLYRVDPDTGSATLIDLGGASVSNGDGILLQGRQLYVLRNRLNQVAVIELAPDLSSGTLVDTITNPSFDVPTTLAQFGQRLYAVNARFTTPPTPATKYSIVQVRR